MPNVAVSPVAICTSASAEAQRPITMGVFLFKRRIEKIINAAMQITPTNAAAVAIAMTAVRKIDDVDDS